jgi:hypothetical protein
MAKDEELRVDMRVKDLRLRDYGEGSIQAWDPTNQYYPYVWEVRWSNPGLDNEWMDAKDLEIIDESARS